MGIRMVAHAIIAYGTPKQKDYCLPRILTAEVFFCQGYSEPESGSDLASLSMSAVDDGEDLVARAARYGPRMPARRTGCSAWSGKSRWAAKTGAGWLPDIWRAFADERGLLGAALPEDVGGIGRGRRPAASCGR
jgi:alkylation response protein AidB-like acyl-CoA dehydrogenase